MSRKELVEEISLAARDLSHQWFGRAFEIKDEKERQKLLDTTILAAIISVASASFNHEMNELIDNAENWLENNAFPAIRDELAHLRKALKQGRILAQDGGKPRSQSTRLNGADATIFPKDKRCVEPECPKQSIVFWAPVIDIWPRGFDQAEEPPITLKVGVYYCNDCKEKTTKAKFIEDYFPLEARKKIDSQVLAVGEPIFNWESCKLNWEDVSKLK